MIILKHEHAMVCNLVLEFFRVFTFLHDPNRIVLVFLIYVSLREIVDHFKELFGLFVVFK
jgi:hypothetical protein